MVGGKLVPIFYTLVMHLEDQGIPGIELYCKALETIGQGVHARLIRKAFAPLLVGHKARVVESASGELYYDFDAQLRRNNAVESLIGRDCKVRREKYAVVLAFLCENSYKASVALTREIQKLGAEAAGRVIPAGVDDEEDADATDDETQAREVITAKLADLTSELDEVRVSSQRLIDALANLYSTNAVTLSARCLTAKTTWDLYEDAVADLGKRRLSPAEQVASIAAQQGMCDAFIAYFDTHWGSVGGFTGFYKHYMKCHLADDRAYYYSTYVIEMWMLSASDSEHGNKMAKGGLRHLQGHYRGLRNKFWMYMRDCILRTLAFPELFLNTHTRLPYT
ncbi:hypothetical protein M885DRAFT_577236, partial [Pelagophyceae sp. CCMP2097]